MSHRVVMPSVLSSSVSSCHVMPSVLSPVMYATLSSESGERTPSTDVVSSSSVSPAPASPLPPPGDGPTASTTPAAAVQAQKRRAKRNNALHHYKRRRRKAKTQHGKLKATNSDGASPTGSARRCRGYRGRLLTAGNYRARPESHEGLWISLALFKALNLMEITDAASISVSFLTFM